MTYVEQTKSETSMSIDKTIQYTYYIKYIPVKWFKKIRRFLNIHQLSISLPNFMYRQYNTKAEINIFHQADTHVLEGNGGKGSGLSKPSL